VFEHFNPLALKIAAITLPLHFLCFAIYLIVSRRKKRSAVDGEPAEPRLMRRRAGTHAPAAAESPSAPEPVPAPAIDQKAATEEIPPPSLADAPDAIPEPASSAPPDAVEAPVSLRGLLTISADDAPKPSAAKRPAGTQRLVSRVNAQGKIEIVVVTDQSP
jgi:hypothetical protein